MLLCLCKYLNMAIALMQGIIKIGRAFCWFLPYHGVSRFNKTKQSTLTFYDEF